MSTPYYADDLVTIYHGDARETMPLGNVLVTDPPYGTGTYAEDRDMTRPLIEWLRHYESAAIFGWPETLVRLCALADRMPDDWIAWWPTNADLRRGSPKGHTPRESEHIAVFGPIRWVHGKPRAKPMSAEYDGRLSRGTTHHSPLGKKWGDVWTDPSPGLGFQSHRRLHPNEKPVSLMERLLGVVADGVVIDPFMGSGSTVVAAARLGRRAIGIEVNEAHCETAAGRLSQLALGLTA